MLALGGLEAASPAMHTMVYCGLTKIRVQVAAKSERGVNVPQKGNAMTTTCPFTSEEAWVIGAMVKGRVL